MLLRHCLVRSPVEFHANILGYYTNNIITSLTEKVQNLCTARGAAAHTLPTGCRGAPEGPPLSQVTPVGEQIIVDTILLLRLLLLLLQGAGFEKSGWC